MKYDLEDRNIVEEGLQKRERSRESEKDRGEREYIIDNMLANAVKVKTPQKLYSVMIKTCQSKGGS